MPLPYLSTVVITGTLGPDVDVTSLTLSNVTDVDFQLGIGVLEITHNYPNNKIQHFDLVLPTTVTFSISGSVATITIS